MAICASEIVPENCKLAAFILARKIEGVSEGKCCLIASPWPGATMDQLLELLEDMARIVRAQVTRQ